jgi:hypothetical protein
MNTVRFPKAVEPLLVPIDQIHPHPSNPNNGDIDATIESIQKSGFVSIITADSNTGEIIAGHTRYAALLALGSKQAPVLWVDHWSKDDALAYLVGDNEVGRRARMDKHQLAHLLTHLRSTEQGLRGTGHDDDTYYRLLQDLAADMNKIPETPGFGGNIAPNGIFQVVIDFDNPEERDEAYEYLKGQYDYTARKVNL